MKTLLFYRPNSAHERVALDYIRDFHMRTGKELETMDVDTPEGAELCRLYEIIDYPAILARDTEGRLLNLWMGEPLPRFDEVGYYTEGISRR